MQENYYAVVGKNGYAVVTHYDKVESVRKYLKRIRTKKFDTYDEALSYAEDVFENLNPGLFLLRKPTVGEIIFATHLRRGY